VDTSNGVRTSHPYSPHPTSLFNDAESGWKTVIQEDRTTTDRDGNPAFTAAEETIAALSFAFKMRMELSSN
jgi:hypothetical protein